VDVGRGGQTVGQLGDRLRLEFRQFQVGGDGHIRRQDPGTAGIGHNGYASAAGDLSTRLSEGAFSLIGKSIGKIEEL